jgi:hypothetical protein
VAGQVLGALGRAGGRCGSFARGLLLNEVYGFSGVLAFHSFTRRGIMIIICWICIIALGRRVLIVLYILSRGTLEFCIASRSRGLLGVNREHGMGVVRTVGLLLAMNGFDCLNCIK